MARFRLLSQPTCRIQMLTRIYSKELMKYSQMAINLFLSALSTNKYEFTNVGIKQQHVR